VPGFGAQFGAIGGIDAVHADFADLGVIFHDSDAATLTDEVLERTLDVNLNAHARHIRLALPHLQASGGGRVVNIASTESIVTTAGLGAYAAT
jgi:NAD(P)-dependent dehydrogenase (short-subunit alcohol dehydrogenase family)